MVAVSFVVAGSRGVAHYAGQVGQLAQYDGLAGGLEVSQPG